MRFNCISSGAKGSGAQLLDPVVAIDASVRGELSFGSWSVSVPQIAQDVEDGSYTCKGCRNFEASQPDRFVSALSSGTERFSAIASTVSTT